MRFLPIASLLLGVWSISYGASPNFDDELVQALDEIVSATVPWTGETPAYSIVVDQGGELVYERYIGFADIGNRVPASRDTVFRIGSISKSYTALAVLQLVEQGKVNLDAKVSNYLPDVEQPSSEVTIRQLLTHTSGVPTYTDQSETRPLLEWTDPTRSHVLDMFQAKDLEFAPGSRYSYSNSGYYLLGLVIEAVSGQDYFEFLQTSILRPLELDETYAGTYEEIVSNRAQGYVAGPDAFENAPPTHQLATFSAGMLEASAADVARYRRSIFRSPKISRQLRKLVTTRDKFDDDIDHYYSLGALVISDFHGHRRFEHNGGLSGFVSEHVFFPDHDLTIVVLINANGAPVSPENLSASLSRKILGIAEPKVTEVDVSPGTLGSYTGLYQMDPFWLAGEFMRVVLKDDSLLLQLYAGSDRQAEIPLLSRGEAVFALAIDESIQIRFVAEKGNVEGLEVVTSSGVSPARRLVEPLP
ncbi:MAG: beta-lactamase family protein, partial [Gammaproteobacteria bacterium]|nr:beta-lactamase family protein [Gammaproteobacteria bacterium]